MLVTIRLFARLREIAGASELERTLPDGATARTAWDALVGEFPPLEDYATAVSCAVNEEYARLTATLEDGDEVAFLPPVSGGSGSPAKAGHRDRPPGFGNVRLQPD
jgi:molybdopterin converting factor subunit 1